MDLSKGKFIHAVFANNKKNLILADWQDNATKKQHEIAVETNLDNKIYVKLLETFSTDEISAMTNQKQKHASIAWESIVKDVAIKCGLIYDPTSTNPQDKLTVDHLFNPPAGDVGSDLLFNIKLKIFDLPQVMQSNNAELKKKLREAKTPLESLYIAGKFLYE